MKNNTETWDGLPQEVCDLTEHLRYAYFSCWPRLRKLLREKGGDPATSWLTEFISEGAGSYGGFIILADCRTFQFDYSCLHRPLEEGVFSEWNDRTAARVHLGANDEVKSVMRFLGSD